MQCPHCGAELVEYWGGPRPCASGWRGESPRAGLRLLAIGALLDAASRLSRSDHVALEVADVEAVRATLEEHGIPYQEGGNRALGMDQLFCRGPDGHVLEFVKCR